jgi:hypothetical protein
MNDTPQLMNKKWYASTAGLIALLFFIFPVGLIFMWRYASWNKVIKSALTGVFVLFLIISISSSGSGKTQTEQASSSNADSTTTAPKVTNIPQKPLSIKDKLKAAYKGDTSNVSIDYDDQTKTAALELTSDKFVDEQFAVNGTFNTFVKYGKEAFKVDGVDIVIVAFRTTFSDKYGKKFKDDIARIGMTKQEFQKFDWNNLDGEPIYTRVKSSASPFFINPAIEDKISTSDIKLSQ